MRGPLIGFETRLRTMLRGIVALRWRQLLYLLGEVAWLIGLKPTSGKWRERITFAYMYILIIGLMTPSVLQVFKGLYALEDKTAPALEATILQTTLPGIVAVLSLLMV